MRETKEKKIGIGGVHQFLNSVLIDTKFLRQQKNMITNLNFFCA